MTRFGRIPVQIYGDEHGVPHFDAVSPAGRASVAIETMLVLAADLRAHEMRAALAWTAINRDPLMAAWLEFSG